ncbi:hypothetical protein [Candidatus Endomicrobiellum agilis]|uniref:hypothetical protein n=1 Tax=Candidatus Endomicrobiellum agilis TaxID=3238957 RepID=UPI00357E8285|nr:hypothetical protein [Endomicrobium sp.]MCA6084745.1 hypothetical protein [Endomicrobium sp.]
MPFYNVKKIQILSLLETLPIIFMILGIVIGLLSFFLLPLGLITGFGFSVRKLLTYFTFVAFYTISTTVGSIVIVWLYNFIAARLNIGITVSLESKVD